MSEHWVGFSLPAVSFFSKMLAYFDVWQPCRPSGSYRVVARIEMPSTATSTGSEKLAAKACSWLKTSDVQNMP
jgi:hypothetical protein